MKNKILIFNIIFQLILIINITNGWAEENNSDSLNDIHIRKGFTAWGDNPVREYKFKNVSVDMKYLTSFPTNYLEQKIPKEVVKNWDIEYWIYTNIEDAELAMVEHLDMSNLFMYNIIDYPLLLGQIGDNCWYQLSVGAIKFLRNNVMVFLQPNSDNVSDDNNIAEWLAREIDKSLIECEKVSYPDLIPAPNILSIDIVSNLPSNWEQTVDVKINATDNNHEYLFYRQYASGFAIISTTGYLTLAFNKLADSSKDPDIAKVKIWVWNENHIVASAEEYIPF